MGGRPEAPVRQVLFIQGGGAGVHDEWDNRLVDSLRASLGDAADVRYPRMPDEADPSASTWVPAIRAELAALDDGAVVVGHSVGGTLLVRALTSGVGSAASHALAAVILVAAPFVGEGGWPADEFAFDEKLGSLLPVGVPVHLFHGSNDATVPASHVDRFADAIPGLVVHRLAGRDHQLCDDLREVAAVIGALDAGGG